MQYLPTITKILEIDAGHRLKRHESKCARLHGHRYVFEVSVVADRLDEVGRVIDFGCVKELVGGWLDREWDHRMLLEEGDPLLFVLDEPERAALDGVVVVSCPPTAENLSRLVYEKATELLAPRGVRVAGVRCWETPTCFADYAPEVSRV